MNCKYCGEKLDSGFLGIGSKCVNPTCNKGEKPHQPANIQREIEKQNKKKIDDIKKAAKNWKPEQAIAVSGVFDNTIYSPYMTIDNIYSSEQKAIIMGLRKGIESYLQPIIPGFKIENFNISKNYATFNTHIQINYSTGEIGNKFTSITVDDFGAEFFNEYQARNSDKALPQGKRLVLKISEQIAKIEGVVLYQGDLFIEK